MSTTLFKEVGYSLSNLMDNIEMGQIGFKVSDNDTMTLIPVTVE